MPPSIGLGIIRPGRQITPALSQPKHLQQADRELHASLSLGNCDVNSKTRYRR